MRFFQILAIVLSFSGTLLGDEPSVCPPGFEPLIQGDTLAGWKGGSTADPRSISAEQQAKWDAEVPKHWRIENGELVNDGQEPHLVTTQEFGNFELLLEWKLPANGDSGIYLRGCPQVQLWDPNSEASRKHGAAKGSGGLWNNEKHERFPLVLADRPTGEWNTMRIRMVGPLVHVELNGQVVVDNLVLENYFDRAIPVFDRGAIHLQTHGSETRFRNLFVREIEAEGKEN